MHRTTDLIEESRRQSRRLHEAMDREVAFWRRMNAVVDPERRRQRST